MLSTDLSRVDLDIVEKASDFGFSLSFGSPPAKETSKKALRSVPVLTVESLAEEKARGAMLEKHLAVAFLLPSSRTDFEALRHLISLHDEGYSVVILRDLGINFFNSRLVLVWRGSNPVIRQFLEELQRWALDALDPLKLSTKLIQLKVENFRLTQRRDEETAQLLKRVSEVEHVSSTKAYKLARRASDLLHNYPTARELSRGLFSLAQASKQLIKRPD